MASRSSSTIQFARPAISQKPLALLLWRGLACPILHNTFHQLAGSWEHPLSILKIDPFTANLVPYPLHRQDASQSLRTGSTAGDPELQPL